MQAMPLAQEKALLEAAQAGDEAAKVALLAQHDRQLWHIARHTRARGETADDLHEWAVLFFLESIGKMDLRRKTRVSTWTYRIVQMRVQGVALRSGVIYLPGSSKRDYPEDYGRAMSQVSSITANNFDMVDQQLGYEDHSAEQREESALFHDALSQLPERLRRIMELRLDGYTLEHIGRHFCLTKERIRQHSDQALKLIREHIGCCTDRRYMAAILSGAINARVA